MIFLPEIKNVIATVMMICRFDGRRICILDSTGSQILGTVPLAHPLGKEKLISKWMRQKDLGCWRLNICVHEAEKLNLEPW
jgi:hypothetical protein